MGIPSYFSYIIKNHPDIIKKLNRLGDIDNFYLDSNSIIYDCLRKLMPEYDGNDDIFEIKLIKAVEIKLREYIKIVKPKLKVYIAFDGVAPVAKLEQQRTRRYKSYLIDHIRKNIDPDYKPTWDKTAITPGTKFMNNLGAHLTKKFNGKNIIVSTTSDPGEGEHKIFQYIRDNKAHHSNTITLIYGLDADLIMLCLNHLKLCKKIYLYRETPEFIKSIDASLEPNEHYFLDIPQLGDRIIEEMAGFKYNSDPVKKYNTLYDYILLAFFLGNDFMPHFPAMNIRTSGMSILISAYRNTICSAGLNLTDGKQIFWGNLRKMIKWLAGNEESNLKDEYKIRNRWEKRSYKKDTIEEKLRKLDNIPTKKRHSEKFIDPYTKHWQMRYYNELFDSDMNKLFIKEVCNNYMEGLEWVMRYYTEGCCDWNWCYKYHYPPLLTDLLAYIPHWETDMIEKNNNKPVSPITQLSYVLPRHSLHLLPDKIRTKLLSEYSDNYPDNCDIKWAFCKYFWESHVDLPSIDLTELMAITS